MVFKKEKEDSARDFDETFSRTMRKMWVQFAKTGNPSLDADISPDGKADAAVQQPAVISAEEAQLELQAGFLVTCRGSKIHVWYGSVSTADSYDIYARYSGEKNAEKVMTVTGTSAVIEKLGGKKPDMKKCFKVYVVARSGGKEIARTFKALVCGGRNEEYTNAKQIRLEKKKLTLAPGKTRKLRGLSL